MNNAFENNIVELLSRLEVEPRGWIEFFDYVSLIYIKQRQRDVCHVTM